VRGSCTRKGVVAAGVDNFQVGYQSLAYLHRLGHRRIAVFNIGPDLMSGIGRYRGICAARDEFAVEVGVTATDAQPPPRRRLQTLFRERLQSPNFPTAVVAEDEIGALGILRALTEAGLEVPRDVSVIACRNARFMEEVMPNITVLDLHQARVAAEAGHLLARMLRRDTPPEPGQRLFAPTLDERGSAAPPRSTIL